MSVTIRAVCTMYGVREVLVVGRLHKEGLGGQIGAAREKFAGQASPGKFVALGVRNLVVTPFCVDALPQAQ